MNWQEISVETEKTAVEAIAELFNEMGAGGVIIEDPELLQKMAESGQWDAYELPAAQMSRRFCVVRGYLPQDEALPEKYEELKLGVAEVFFRLGQEPAGISLQTVNEEDWANSWKAYFKPVKIGRRLVIRPSWEPYRPAAGEVVLDLDPGMAFGTGSHVTTVMCARFLEKYLKRDAAVIDVGTGSGILAIAAAKLGAKAVLALDNDAVAVRCALENISRNSLKAEVRVRQNDLLSGVVLKADMITANIIASVIVALFGQVGNCLAKDGLFIVSGIITERRQEVIDAAEQAGFRLIDEDGDGEWVAQIWQR